MVPTQHSVTVGALGCISLLASFGCSKVDRVYNDHLSEGGASSTTSSGGIDSVGDGSSQGGSTKASSATNTDDDDDDDNAQGGTSSSEGGGGLGGTSSSEGGGGLGGTSSSEGGGGLGGASSSEGGGGLGGASSSEGGGGLGGASVTEEITYGSPGQSCDSLTTTCQSCTSAGVCGDAESCCTNIVVPSGTFMMGRSEESSVDDYYSSGADDEVPAHGVTVSSFTLDKYEVTVGRFRKFVEAYDTWYSSISTNLASGTGAHSTISSSGWDTSWTSSLASSASSLMSGLKCDSTYQTWTDDAGNNETYPINCVNWYEAMTFCIWDGGYLPTEAEWEYAAAGGSEERLYPWGATAPDATHMNWGSSAASPYVAVGSYTDGHGRWLHEDLAGSMYEWTLDQYGSNWYSDDNASGSDVCNLTADSAHPYRGGCWFFIIQGIFRAADRDSADPSFRDQYTGFRCARAAL